MNFSFRGLALGLAMMTCIVPLAQGQKTTDEFAQAFMQAMQDQELEAMLALMPTQAHYAQAIHQSGIPEEEKVAELEDLDSTFPATNEEMENGLQDAFTNLSDAMEQLNVTPSDLEIVSLQADTTLYRGVFIGRMDLTWKANGMGGTIRIPHLFKCGDQWRFKKGEFRLLRARPLPAGSE